MAISSLLMIISIPIVRLKVFTTTIFHLVGVVLIPQTRTTLQDLQIGEGWFFIYLLSCTKFTNTCSFTIHFKIISACSKVFVECTICFGELKEAFSFFFSVSVTH